MKLKASDIIYEDNHLLVLEKKPGILSQEDRSGDPDILNLAKDYIKERDHKPGAVYMGLVHRLDRNTGGVMCLAKTSKAASRLSAQVREKSWEKRYLALSTYKLSAPRGSAAAERGAPSVSDSWELWQDALVKDEKRNLSFSKKGGKKAVSAVRLLAAKKWQRKRLYLREFILLSGRSHQIRVQSAERNFPLLGDLKYGGETDASLPQDYLGLWAYSLEIIHPVKKEKMRFFSLPDSMPFMPLFSAAVEEARAEAETEVQALQELLQKAREI